MPPVEMLTHTADLRIRVSAASIAELFAEALRGMTNASGPVWAGENEISREVSVSSPDRNALLVDFLSEALRWGDTNNEAYTNVVFEEISDTSLRARLIGRPIKGLALEIKAVTHHELEIKRSASRWTTNIIFDI